MTAKADDKPQRFDLDSLLDPSPAHKEMLRGRIDDLRKSELSPKLRTKWLCHNLGLTVNEDRFNHWMGGKGPLPDADYRKLVRHLWDEKWFTGLWLKEGLARHEDALFHALNNFLAVGAQTVHNLADEVPGLYRVWRPSMHVPGRYVRGKALITHYPATAALKMIEIHVFRGEKGGAAAQKEVFEGYIVKKSRFLIVIARQSGSHAGPPRVTMIHNTIRSDTGAIEAMQGVVTGSYGENALFSAPVYIERVADRDEAALDRELDITQDIPFSIKAKLRFDVRDDVIRF